MRAGALKAVLAPSLGGSLAALHFNGRDLLRPAPEKDSGPLEMASFPLLPYANRIAHGRFSFNGRDHRVPLNFGDHPHSLHGLGWTSAWTVESQSQSAACLAHRHDGGAGWPWPYQAEQRFVLTPDAVELTLSVQNVGEESMPVGLGFHPYFPADDATHLQFEAEGLWLSTEDMLPRREVAAGMLGDWSTAAPVIGDSLIDNVYGGWDGCATIVRGDGLTLRLTAPGVAWLHVYRPPLSPFFCVEPVSHMPDAINRPQGMEALAPGAVRQIAMRIAIVGKEGVTA